MGFYKTGLLRGGVWGHREWEASDWGSGKRKTAAELQRGVAPPLPQSPAPPSRPLPGARLFLKVPPLP